MEPIRRSINTEVTYDGEGVFRAVARIIDPFHEIEVALRVSAADLTIIEAQAEMIRTPYSDYCSNSMLHIDTLVDVQIGPSLHRNVRDAVGGDCGCPYLVDLVVQACKLAIVTAGVEQARKAVLVEQDLKTFAAVRRTMGKCAGHTDLPDARLPEWLERERKGQNPLS